MEGSATLTIEASTKSKNATPHKNTSVSWPRRVERNDVVMEASGGERSERVD